jgi:hypothetical protein
MIISIAIALSLDGFGSISWHSVWFFSALLQFSPFFRISNFLAWVPLKRLDQSKCASGASNLVSYEFYIVHGKCRAGRYFHIGCILCAINSSNTFRLTFSKFCTVVMDILKVWIRLLKSLPSAYFIYLLVNDCLHHRQIPSLLILESIFF